MLILEYHKDGVHVADHDAMSIAEGMIERANHPDITFETRISQAMILDALRVLIKRKVIDHKLIKIKFENNIIYVDETANLSDWPRGFCDHTENYLMELI